MTNHFPWHNSNKRLEKHACQLQTCDSCLPPPFPSLGLSVKCNLSPAMLYSAAFLQVLRQFCIMFLACVACYYFSFRLAAAAAVVCSHMIFWFCIQPFLYLFFIGCAWTKYLRSTSLWRRHCSAMEFNIRRSFCRCFCVSSDYLCIGLFEVLFIHSCLWFVEASVLLLIWIESE